MEEFENYRVRVEGYTDSIGEADYNQMLSLERAESVRAELLAAGIAPNRILVQGFGEQYPKASNSNAAGRQENRRVEIVISDRDGNIGSR
jgi:outer membrane protein OmpA-like peptidoglycan-associated protein